MAYRALNDQDEGDIETGTRVCRDCTTRQSMTKYYWAPKSKGYRSRSCKSCWRLRAQENRASHPDPEARKIAAFERHLRITYGISREDFDKILAVQGYACAICRDGLTVETAHVDHCHQANVIRGLLCFSCNTGIGKFGDNPVRLRTAAQYVEYPPLSLPCEPRYLTPQEITASRRAARLKKTSRWKPRPAPGQLNPAAKITDAQALEVKAMYATGSVTQATIAAKYSISQAAVSRIVRGQLRAGAVA